MSPSTAEVRGLEERGLSAWPALRTAVLDGWVLRFSNGYTRRANSVNPLYPGAMPLGPKIAACEEMFERQGLECVFKLCAASLPEGLDAALEARGYRREAETAVECIDLKAGVFPAGEPVEFRDELDTRWVDAVARMNRQTPAQRAASQAILSGIVPDHRFASALEDGSLVGLGLGVLDRGWLGLFDILVDPARRRRGIGRRIVLGLLDWGRREGAHHAYLQVGLDNEPARRMYAGMGFAERYRYWYRRRVQGTED